MKLTTIQFNSKQAFRNKIISACQKEGWNINASDEKWEQFSSELISKQSDVAECIADNTKPLNQRYKQVVGIIDKAARKTIGKTTFKNGKKTRLSLSLIHI